MVGQLTDIIGKPIGTSKARASGRASASSHNYYIALRDMLVFLLIAASPPTMATRNYKSCLQNERLEPVASNRNHT